MASHLVGSVNLDGMDSRAIYDLDELTVWDTKCLEEAADYMHRYKKDASAPGFKPNGDFQANGFQDWRTVPRRIGTVGSTMAVETRLRGVSSVSPGRRLSRGWSAPKTPGSNASSAAPPLKRISSGIPGVTTSEERKRKYIQRESS